MNSAKPASPLELLRGVNIEGWLSPDLWFDTHDAARVAELGFDHIRVNVNEQHLWDDSARPIRETFDRVDELLDACSGLGLKAVFDLHVLRTHFFNAPQRPLFHKPGCLEEFLNCWRRLSAHLRDRPCSMLAYELLNEPVADDPADWNRVAAAGIQLLRSLEPQRTIVLGSNKWSGPDTFADLAVPHDDNLILTFHFYYPFLVTHHGASPYAAPFHTGPVHYPGRPIAEEDLANLTAEQRQSIAIGNAPENRQTMAAHMAAPLAVAARTGLPLYCGEFGCYNNVARDDRLRWHADISSILAEHRIGWAAYAYRGRWATVWAEGHIDREIVARLIGR